ERGPLEPVHQPPGDTAAAMARRDREQVEVGAVVAVTHDGEARDGGPGAGREHHAVGIADVPRDARRVPGRPESALHLLARHPGKGPRLRGAGRLETVRVAGNGSRAALRVMCHSAQASVWKT